ncbi:hypothetical protein FDB30_16370 [Clostridium botulinum]|uniref:hypothetical protein n=1 Tax=Clostridium botulinum TaxID=1491 RepID=UPI00077477FF|nr:hypothetical protein [Clostridium botulinum]NFG38423.1 hypothetical protein [Clostridium botulinum]NFO02385.1 hypothetical protein [Clostridium botulinum]
MYTIGLIDDEQAQLKSIRRTIKTNAPQNVQYDFKNYSLSNESSKLVDEVFDEIIKDIKNKQIACLIIDYKIMVRTTKVKGTDIFGMVKKAVPRFPIIILTDVIEESIEPDFIDADKVYRKSEFFKLLEEYSKEKTLNIFDSMKKYIGKRDSLQLTLTDLQKKMVEGNSIEENLDEVLKVENELDDFCPIEQTQIDKVFDTDKVKKIVELIEKANNLLE